MKKVTAVMLTGVISLCLAACGSQKEKKTELIVFAAASMTETLTEIGELYKAANSDIDVVFNFDSSGTLKTQIQEGAECDLFISAGQKQMNQLDITADSTVNAERLDYVLQDTRMNILENKVTLCVADPGEGSDGGEYGREQQGGQESVIIRNFDGLAEALKNGTVLLAMGNEDVPVGQYTQKILAYYGLNEQELAAVGVISYGSNVKEVTTQVSEGSVDCGIIYCTDAFSAGLTVQDYATADMCGQVIYPAAVMKNSKHPEAAKEFLEFLQTEQCMKIFEKVGFSGVN